MSEQPPHCFGHDWSNEAPECRGGYDATYTGMNGTKVRPPCEYFHTCQSRTVMNKATAAADQSRRLVAPESLIRQPPPPSAPSFQRPWMPPQQAAARPYSPPYAPPTAPPQAPQWAPPQMHQPPMYPPPAQPQYHHPGQHVVQAAPIQMVPTNYGVPTFLSTPEDRGEDGFWAPTFREALRGAGKGFFLTLAGVFDHISFKRKR